MSNDRNRPFGRRISDFGELNPAEIRLQEACRTGTMAILSDALPQVKENNNLVRASFLRFLILGGDDRTPIHEHSVQLQGAWIEGVLDLDRAQIFHSIVCKKCHFHNTIIFRDARIEGGIFLSGSDIPGIKGDGVKVHGPVNLNDGFRSRGHISLDSAEIDGQLNFNTSFIAAGKGAALIADKIEINGNLFLSEGFGSEGEIRFVGSHIKGNLVCSGARLDGKGGDALSFDRSRIESSVFLDKNIYIKGSVRFPGAKIGDDFYCIEATLIDDNKNIEKSTLLLNRIRIESAFYFKRLLRPVDRVSLAQARIDVLEDDMNSWGKDIILDGFLYRTFGRESSISPKLRLEWLDRQPEAHSGKGDKGDNFRPQPWRQLQKVLQEMGHFESARYVAIKHEQRLRKADLIGKTTNIRWLSVQHIYRVTARMFHRLFGILTGYGHRPLRLLVWFIVIWLVSAGVYWFAALNQAVFAPSDPLVFQNTAYQVCMPGNQTLAAKSEGKSIHSEEESIPAVRGAGNWYLCEKLPEEYSAFSPLAYSLDIILPLVDLKQENEWGPLVPVPEENPFREFITLGWKHFTRLVIWFETLFGWLISLLFVAIVSGLTKRMED